MAIYVLSQLLVISTFLSISIFADASGPTVIAIDWEKRSINSENYGSSLRRRQNPVVVDLNNRFYSYLATIKIGTPPQAMTIDIVIDSDVTWIPDLSSPLCQNDHNSCQTGGAFNSSASTTFIDYGPGNFDITYPGGTQSNGDFINDLVMLGNATLTKTTLGLATNGSVTSGVIGILGLGSGAAGGTGSGGSANYTNILDTLKSQAYITTRAFSLWLNDADASTGSLLLGGVDTAKYHGELNLLFARLDFVSNGFEAFHVPISAITGFTISSGQTFYSSSAGLSLPTVFNPGDSYTYLEDSIASAINTAVGVQGSNTTVLTVPCSASDAYYVFEFQGSVTFNIPQSAFIGQAVSGQAGMCYWELYSAPSGTQFLGDNFLRYAYVVYDYDNSQIGLAQTNFNATTSNIIPFSNSSIPAIGIIQSALTTSTSAATISITSTFSFASTATSNPESSSTSSIATTTIIVTQLGTTTGSVVATQTGNPAAGWSSYRNQAGALSGSIGLMFFLFG